MEATFQKEGTAEFGFLAEFAGVKQPFGPEMREKQGTDRAQEERLNRSQLTTERRKGPRLPLAIPVFVRSRDEDGKDFLEFATAVNVSAIGALVAMRRPLPLWTQVSLEIPSAPWLAAAAGSKASRMLRARTVRITYADGYHLVGLSCSPPADP